MSAQVVHAGQRAGDRLGDKARTRLDALFATDDPTGEIAAAWQCKELLRRLLAAHGPTLHSRHRTAHHLTRFLTACADAGLEETTRLATTVERWWPEIEIKRVGCGFRNQANYERRIMLHSATRLFTSTILRMSESLCVPMKCPMGLDHVTANDDYPRSAAGVTVTMRLGGLRGVSTRNMSAGAENGPAHRLPTG